MFSLGGNTLNSLRLIEKEVLIICANDIVIKNSIKFSNGYKNSMW